MKPGTRVGRALLQTPEEWDVRNDALAESLSELATRYIVPRTRRGLDVGCQTGRLLDHLRAQTGFAWAGVDPNIKMPTATPAGSEMLHGWAHDLPFPDSSFDCVVLANVYEHVDPGLRDVSLRELRRVLSTQGILVGQLPNPYFPIESHSRLPLMGWLPMRLQKAYWSLSPVSWEHNFHVVTAADVRSRAQRLGFETVLIRPFNYPLAAIPRSLRPVARLLERPMKHLPWSWQFVFRRVG
jgi:SAM-dependent methyltransferase